MYRVGGIKVEEDKGYCRCVLTDDELKIFKVSGLGWLEGCEPSGRVKNNG